MKIRNGKLIFGLTFIFLCVFLSIFSFKIASPIALVENKDSQLFTNYYNRENWKWTPIDVISNESTTGAVDPSLAVDSQGNVHLAWHDPSDAGGSGSDYDIFYKCWNYSTSTWMNLEVISTESVNGSGGPSLAVDSYDNIHIAWNDESNYTNAGEDWDIFYKKWEAASNSWSLTEVVSTESTEDSTIPSLTVDTIGNVHIAWTDLTNFTDSGFDSDIFYKRKLASTSSWTTTKVVSTESTGNANRASIAVDAAGSVYIVWEDSTTYTSDEVDMDIIFRRWNAITSTWKDMEIVSNESAFHSYYPSITVFSVGQVHIVWSDLHEMAESGGDLDIFYKNWESSSVTWSPVECVSTESNIDSRNPSITVDRFGSLHVSWYDGHRINYKRLDVLSSAWTLTEIVSSENPNVRTMPSLAVDHEGTIHVSWQDKEDYDGAGVDFDIFYRKLIGPPQPPELAVIDPNPTESNLISLDWSDHLGVSTYYIFRSNEYIWSVEGMIPLTNTSSSEYIDTLPSEGSYYYAIVAENFAGNSSHSNCESVNYAIPHLKEFLIPFSVSFGLLVVILIPFFYKRRNNVLRT